MNSIDTFTYRDIIKYLFRRNRITCCRVNKLLRTVIGKVKYPQFAVLDKDDEAYCEQLSHLSTKDLIGVFDNGYWNIETPQKQPLDENNIIILIYAIERGNTKAYCKLAEEYIDYECGTDNDMALYWNKKAMKYNCFESAIIVCEILTTHHYMNGNNNSNFNIIKAIQYLYEMAIKENVNLLIMSRLSDIFTRIILYNNKPKKETDCKCRYEHIVCDDCTRTYNIKGILDKLKNKKHVCYWIIEKLKHHASRKGWIKTKYDCKTNEISIKQIIKNNWSMLAFIDETKKTKEICQLAYEQNKLAWIYIPPTIRFSIGLNQYPLGYGGLPI